MEYLPTVEIMTAMILRDHPDLRDTSSREKVWLRIKQKHPNVKFSTVERCCRKIQNTLGMYVPTINDNRYTKEATYRQYFGNK